ncbi:DUF4194 domain-containing protein [Brevibacterium litoralis]|uniref:DUF4194 domain-containing protein n=1 Tax=Brevibacterium litoralis TaxID=3138935 RepID=UPI0032EC8A27
MTTEPSPVDAEAPAAQTEDSGFSSEVRDTSRMDMRARRALATLLRSRFVSRRTHKQVWDALVVFRAEIEESLADMFLELVIDEEFEVAFKRQFPDETAPRMLRRDRALTREATVLLVHLRQVYDGPDSVDGVVRISRAQVLELLRPGRHPEDGDDRRFEARVDAAIHALENLGLLSEEDEEERLYTVSPVVVPLVGSEELRRITEYFESAAAAAREDATVSSASGEDSDAADATRDDAVAEGTAEVPGQGASDAEDDTTATETTGSEEEGA